MPNLFERALQRLIKVGRKEPGAPTEGLEKQARNLLAAYEAELRPDAPPRWGGVDHEQFASALLLLLEDARNEGRQMAARDLAPLVAETCACRCRAHQEWGCPECLHVQGCPVHADLDPVASAPDVLSDPPRLAEAIWEEVVVVGDELFSTQDPDGVASFLPWRMLSGPTREVFVEAIRRAVCSRVPR